MSFELGTAASLAVVATAIHTYARLTFQSPVERSRLAGRLMPSALVGLSGLAAAVLVPRLVVSEPHRGDFRFLDGGGELWIGLVVCLAWAIRSTRRARVRSWPVLAELVPFMLIASGAYGMGCIFRASCGPLAFSLSAFPVAAAVALHRAWTIEPRTVVALGLATLGTLQTTTGVLTESQYVEPAVSRSLAAGAVMTIVWGANERAARTRRREREVAAQKHRHRFTRRDQRSEPSHGDPATAETPAGDEAADRALNAAGTRMDRTTAVPDVVTARGPYPPSPV